MLGKLFRVPVKYVVVSNSRRSKSHAVLHCTFSHFVSHQVKIKRHHGIGAHMLALITTVLIAISLTIKRNKTPTLS